MSSPESLVGKPLSYFKPHFSLLRPPSVDELKGVYRGQFTGPAWLRFSAPSTLALGGMSGWWGKIIQEEGRGFNLVLRQKCLKLIFPIRLATIPSLVDGKPGLTVQYSAECPFPWPHVIDELRWLENPLLYEPCLLGLTIVQLGFLRNFAFPFLLFPDERTLGQPG